MGVAHHPPATTTADPGRAIREAREAAGLNQKDARRLCACSASTMSRLENGRAAEESITTLRRVALALHIRPEALGLAPRGTPTALRRADRVAPTRGDAMRRRTLLTGLLAVGGVTALGGSIDQQPSSAEAQQLLVRARAAFTLGRYAQTASLLPPLVASGQPATALLVHAYALASEVATKTNDDDVSWIAADRSLTAAREIGDPLLIAEAAQRVAVVLRRSGHPGEAADLLATALDGLPETPTALRGDLLLTASYTAAVGGNASDAATLLRAASHVALRVPHLSTETTFSSQQVLTYGISVYNVLGESGRALHYARQVEPRTQRTPERRARYAVDTAHAWQLHGRRDQAVMALLAAERAAPEELCRASVRSRTRELLERPGPTPAGLRDLATRSAALA